MEGELWKMVRGRCDGLGARAGGQGPLITTLEGLHLSAILSLSIPQDKTLGHTS